MCLFLFSLCSIILIEQMQIFTIMNVFLFLTYLSGCFFRTMFLLILQNVHMSKIPEGSVFFVEPVLWEYLFCGGKGIFFYFLALTLVSSNVSYSSNQCERTLVMCHCISIVILRGILCCQ